MRTVWVTLILYTLTWLYLICLLHLPKLLLIHICTCVCLYSFPSLLLSVLAMKSKHAAHTLSSTTVHLDLALSALWPSNWLLYSASHTVCIFSLATAVMYTSEKRSSTFALILWNWNQTLPTFCFSVVWPLCNLRFHVILTPALGDWQVLYSATTLDCILLPWLVKSVQCAHQQPAFYLQTLVMRRNVAPWSNLHHTALLPSPT